MRHDIALLWAGRLEDPALLPHKMVLHFIQEDGRPSFCALGVLCQMFMEAHPGQFRWTQLNQSGVRYIEGEACTVPPIVQQWADLHSRVGLYYPEGRFFNNPFRSIAMDANSHDISMSDIAGTIRLHWDDL